MEKYHIKSGGNEGVFERKTVFYTHITVRDILDPYSLSTITDAKITIESPCGTELLASTSMNNLSTAVYDYEYTIPADAEYGEYKVTIDIYVGASIEMRKVYRFFVFPWDILPQVRLLAGISDNKDIGDDALANITWKAYQEALDDVYEIHKDTIPRCDPYTGEGFNGTNKEFRTKDKYLADHDGDGSVTGYSTSSACTGDVIGWWRDSTYTRYTCKITVNSADDGNIQITQTDDSAIPSDHKGVGITYWTKWRTFKEAIFREAIEYLAAYKVTRRFSERDRATLVDVNSNMAIFKSDSDMLLKEYKKAINKIRKPLCGGV